MHGDQAGHHTRRRRGQNVDDCGQNVASERQMILESVITCPHCATAKAEAMPVDACRYFYNCTGCGQRLRPKRGDCCVFCSYGTVPCPPIQAQRAGEPGAASCGGC
jgi:predicted SprT family Zn-dependent metalloprotease